MKVVPGPVKSYIQRDTFVRERIQELTKRRSRTEPLSFIRWRAIFTIYWSLSA